jgi:hypothetical protein
MTHAQTIMSNGVIIVPHQDFAHPSHWYYKLQESNEIGKVYSLEHTKISKVFFNCSPHRGQWCQQGNQGNNKCNNSMKGNGGAKVFVAM